MQGRHRRLVPGAEARPVEKLDEWLTRIENELGEYKAQNPEKKVAPYPVNQIRHISNDRLMKDMETCVMHKVPRHHHLVASTIGNCLGRAFLWRRGVP
jgi:NAD(P)H-dependent flavin oxidoreductase YrpB (nitropropane dioxygenase family)